MTVRELRARGQEWLGLASELLQRARLADPDGGLWDAADLQWWWRRPRESDGIDQVLWVDEHGPVAGVLLTRWGERWQCDPLLVAGVAGPTRDAVWARALEQLDLHTAGAAVEVPVRDDDVAGREQVTSAGFGPGEVSSTAWLAPNDRPAVRPLPEGFRLVDRSQRTGTPHPMRVRNGEGVAERLASGSLYDPELDLSVETDDGEPAAYSLYWFDPATGEGLVEPVRVEDDYQRRGLATAMITEGIDRLVRRGAQRVTIGYGTEAAGSLYLGLGFRFAGTATWWTRPVSS